MQTPAQIALPVQATRPACLVWYAGDPCDQQVQQYRQQVENQLRLDWQSSVTARFEKQIADQQKQITEQQAQIRTLQARIDARSQAFIDGIGVIIGIGLAFLLVVAAFRKLSHYATPDAEHNRTASA